ncbi:MAG: mandelate racemase/muconate lactonizing enzyme family protein [Opitutales bacterium]
MTTPPREPALSAQEPILNPASLGACLTIASIELLRHGTEFLVRIRSTDGAESVTVPNSGQLKLCYPIFLERVAPFFIGEDACNLEALLERLYRDKSNYKFQGLAWWICVAAVEMGLLDLLGRVTGKAIGELFGGVRRRDIPLYVASHERGNSPEAELDHLRALVGATGCRALKFRVGGRMSANTENPAGRSEALIPLVREAFGPEMTLYADANSSFDVAHAVRLGRLMEAHDYAFFEEPCPFDHLWETRQVTQALELPIAGGEQEVSLRRFQWLIENRGVDVVQPDLHYFGGYVRCTRVARLAQAAGMPCTVHMSGWGLGYLNALHFASYIENPGPYQEFKGESTIPMEISGSDLKCRDGSVRVPTGPGFGVQIDPAYVAKAQPVTSLN